MPHRNNNSIRHKKHCSPANETYGHPRVLASWIYLLSFSTSFSHILYQSGIPNTSFTKSVLKIASAIFAVICKHFLTFQFVFIPITEVISANQISASCLRNVHITWKGIVQINSVLWKNLPIHCEKFSQTSMHNDNYSETDTQAWKMLEHGLSAIWLVTAESKKNLIGWFESDR